MAEQVIDRDGVYRTPSLRNRIPEPEPSDVHTHGTGRGIAPAHFDGKLVCRLAIDVGGTFTDAVLEDGDDSQSKLAVKVLTTPARPAEGLLDAAQAALKAGCRRPEQVRLLLHGTTLATNAILERKGAVTAMIATEGFCDTLALANSAREDAHDLRTYRRMPLVPQHLCFEVQQRMAADGTEITPLDEAAVRALVPSLTEAKVESIAICFLHSHLNDAHEDRAAVILRTLLPGVAICTSSRVSPEAREYPRFSTAVANAYVQPLISTYLKDAESLLEANGFRCPVLLMTSGGGLTDVYTAAALPARLIESGPAGGVVLAENAARELGAKRVLSLDVGGTTAKLCAVTDGRAAAAREFEVDRAQGFKKHSGLPVHTPCLDLVEISGGGGSIASIDPLGGLLVGPDSAGSVPGPACYCRGGTAATITDADVLLGRIDTSAFAAGTVQLRADAARRAIHDNVAVPQKRDSDYAAAHAIAEVVEETLAVAAKAHIAEHGDHAPLEDFVLIAFGGAAPLRACSLAEKLGVQKVLIPPDASVGSAIGFLSAPLAFEVTRVRLMRLDEASFAPCVVNEIYRALWHETVSVIAAAAARWKPGRPAKERRCAYVRYVGQGHELPISLPDRDVEPGDAQLLRSQFEQVAEQQAFVIPGAPMEVVTWSLGLVADSDPVAWTRERLRQHRPALGGADATLFPHGSPCATRSLYDADTGRCDNVPVFRREDLSPGQLIKGPAVIAENYTSTVVLKTFQAIALQTGFLQLVRRSDSQPSIAPPMKPAKGSAGHSAMLFWRRLQAAAQEQADLLMRLAFSPVAREAGGVACAYFDCHGRQLAQSQLGSPRLWAATRAVVQSVVNVQSTRDAIEPKAFVDGQVMLTSHPWASPCMPADLVMLLPVYHDGHHAGFFCSCCHGMAALERREPVMCKIGDLAFAGFSGAALGDVHALEAVSKAASGRATDALRDFGAVTFSAFSDFVMEASKAAVLRNMAACLGACANGSATTAHSLHNSLQIDSRRLALTCQIHFAKDQVIVGLGASSDAHFPDDGATLHANHIPENDAVGEGVAMPLAYAEAYAIYALMALFGKGIPFTAGAISAFDVRAEQGSVFNANSPSGEVGWRCIAGTIPNLVLGCFAGTEMDSQVPAESAAGICHLELSLKDSQDSGMQTMVEHVEVGGMGAFPDCPGLSAQSFSTPLRSTSVEITEAAAGVVIKKRKLRRDSGGRGLHNGGEGVLLELQPRDGFEMYLMPGVVRATHWHHRARGKSGGGTGGLATIAVSSSSGVQDLSPDFVHASAAAQPIRVPCAATLLVETAGGGGFGLRPDDVPSR